MNLFAYFTRGIIWGQRKFFASVRPSAGVNPLRSEMSGEEANELIAARLRDEAPFMVARFGGQEIETTTRGNAITSGKSVIGKWLDIALGNNGPFWWDDSIRYKMRTLSGFFPTTDEMMMRFAKQSMEDSRSLDLIASYSWATGLTLLSREFFPKARVIGLDDLEFIRFEHPWTRELKGRKVLVVHPFAETIERQYARRRQIWNNDEVLPEFELKTVKAVSSLGGTSEFADWFAALEDMKRRIAEVDFDIAIIGCGAYGFSLAAFIKRELGKKAVHLGGVTQILFGIKGGRWDPLPQYNRFYNEAWVRPSEAERPDSYQAVERGCYW